MEAGKRKESRTTFKLTAWLRRVILEIGSEDRRMWSEGLTTTFGVGYAQFASSVIQRQLALQVRNRELRPKSRLQPNIWESLGSSQVHGSVWDFSREGE